MLLSHGREGSRLSLTLEGGSQKTLAGAVTLDLQLSELWGFLLLIVAQSMVLCYSSPR